MGREYRSAQKENQSVSQSASAEMSQVVKKLAFPSEPGESAKSCIRRVAKDTKLGFGVIKRIWYKERKIIPTELSDFLREAVKRQEHDIDQRIAALRERQARYYALTHHSMDQEFYRVRAAETERGFSDDKRDDLSISQEAGAKD